MNEIEKMAKHIKESVNKINEGQMVTFVMEPSELEALRSNITELRSQGSLSPQDEQFYQKQLNKAIKSQTGDQITLTMDSNMRGEIYSLTREEGGNRDMGSEREWIEIFGLEPPEIEVSTPTTPTTDKNNVGKQKAQTQTKTAIRKGNVFTFPENPFSSDLDDKNFSPEMEWVVVGKSRGLWTAFQQVGEPEIYSLETAYLLDTGITATGKTSKLTILQTEGDKENQPIEDKLVAIRARINGNDKKFGLTHVTGRHDTWEYGPWKMDHDEFRKLAPALMKEIGKFAKVKYDSDPDTGDGKWHSPSISIERPVTFDQARRGELTKVWVDRIDVGDDSPSENQSL